MESVSSRTEHERADVDHTEPDVRQCEREQLRSHGNSSDDDPLQQHFVLEVKKDCTYNFPGRPCHQEALAWLHRQQLLSCR